MLYSIARVNQLINKAAHPAVTSEDLVITKKENAHQQQMQMPSGNLQTITKW